MSKLWSGDISTLSTQEVMNIIQNLFYQAFLVEVTDLNFAIRVNEDGLFVKFIIDGEAYADVENLDPSEKLEMDGI